MKLVKGWVVIDPKGRIIYASFEEKKTESIFQLSGRMDKEWNTLYKQGYRCIRVTLKADE